MSIYDSFSRKYFFFRKNFTTDYIELDHFYWFDPKIIISQKHIVLIKWKIHPRARKQFDNLSNAPNVQRCHRSQSNPNYSNESNVRVATHIRAHKCLYVSHFCMSAYIYSSGRRYTRPCARDEPGTTAHDFTSLATLQSKKSPYIAVSSRQLINWRRFNTAMYIEQCANDD